MGISVAGGLSCESKFQGGVNGCDCSNYQLTKCPSWGGFYEATSKLNYWLINIYRGKRIIEYNIKARIQVCFNRKMYNKWAYQGENSIKIIQKH
nr:MAG TPA: hypothetical protein [Caudoviricetes sp.]